jgi:hypothetical protein
MTTTAQPAWLRARNNDPYGTPDDHPFWDNVQAKPINGCKVFQADGAWRVYDTRWNAWWNYPDEAAALKRAEQGPIDVWA